MFSKTLTSAAALFILTVNATYPTAKYPSLHTASSIYTKYPYATPCSPSVTNCPSRNYSSSVDFVSGTRVPHTTYTAPLVSNTNSPSSSGTIPHSNRTGIFMSSRTNLPSSSAIIHPINNTAAPIFSQTNSPISSVIIPPANKTAVPMLSQTYISATSSIISQIYSGGVPELSNTNKPVSSAVNSQINDAPSQASYTSIPISLATLTQPYRLGSSKTSQTNQLNPSTVVPDLNNPEDVRSSTSTAIRLDKTIQPMFSDSSNAASTTKSSEATPCDAETTDCYLGQGSPIVTPVSKTEILTTKSILPTLLNTPITLVSNKNSMPTPTIQSSKNEEAPQKTQSLSASASDDASENSDTAPLIEHSDHLTAAAVRICRSIFLMAAGTILALIL